MGHVNVEFKARCYCTRRVRRVLEERGAEYRGQDRQIDTYFNVERGRLKLREGNIENNLIYYERPDRAGPKESLVSLAKTERDSGLREVLTNSLGVKVVVDKTREIYFVDNVKIHIDDVVGLGNFVEVEAIGELDGDRKKLEEQCRDFLGAFGISDEQLVAESYSDMLLGK